MTREQRRAQLLAAARELIRDAGTDDFTLARLAQAAGVTKPLVYDHFGDRAGVLAELYRAFEEHQRDTLATALDGVGPDLPARVRLVSAAYIDCCLAEGQEMADVVAALAGSSTLSKVRHEAEEEYVAMARSALQPLAGPIDSAGMSAIIGAGDALARSALSGAVEPSEARAALSRVVAAVITSAGSEETP